MAFTDTFSNPSGSAQNLTARSGWTLVAGAASDALIGAGNNSLSSVPTGEYLAWCTDQGSADHKTSVVVLDTCASWWVIRASDQNNFIGARHNGTAWQVFKRVAGTFTQLGSDYTVALTAGDVADLEAVGDLITFKVNGTLRCLGSGVTETFNNTVTRQGLQVRNSGATAWLDSFTATGPAGVFAVAVTETITPTDTQAATVTHTKAQAEAVTAAESTSASISSLPPGTFTSGIFARNGGEENSASTALTYVSVCNPTTGLQLSLRTGLSTSGTGQLVFTDPVMVAGTAYLVEWLEAGGHRGWDVQVAT